ncbi:MAG: serine/threonine-protein kinase [Acidobacteriota bacterium]|nr:serine/threonine-protein kinase [Acidobacteriota bacterium]
MDNSKTQKDALHLLEAFLSGGIDDPIAEAKRNYPENGDLKKQLELLLEAHDCSDTFLDKPLLLRYQGLWVLEADQQDPEEIDGYEVVDLLGTGGMGRVYRVRQCEPEREIALKLFHGFPSDNARRRFQMECLMLARMSHPNIAHIYEVGSFRSMPYFTMEYFPGKPITTYSSENGLGLRERLQVFLQVCAGIMHVHDHDIIHRDIKPSNILVCTLGRLPHAKVIDFGVAKQVLGPRLTQTQMVLGTPAYASPEQIGMEEISTKSDVYSLGCVLYELVTGCPPFDPERLKTKSYGDVLKIIQEEDPPLPSKIQRQEDPTDISPAELRGDVDLVVRKAMEKDAEVRYATVALLAEDIRNILDFKPVTARRPSLHYRIRKTIRRHTRVVTVATVMGLVLLTIAFFLADQYLENRTLIIERGRQQVKAREIQVRFQAVEEVVHHLLQDPNPFHKTARDRGRAFLERAEKEVDELYAFPVIRANCLFTLGQAYLSTSNYSSAERCFHKGYDLRSAIFGEAHPNTVAFLERLGYLYNRTNRFKKAEQVFEKAISTISVDAAISLSLNQGLADTLRLTGRFQEASELYHRTLNRQIQVLGGGHRDISVTRRMLANGLRLEGRHKEAEKQYRLALDAVRNAYGPDHWETWSAEESLVVALIDAGRYQEAKQRISRVLEQRISAFGKDHEDSLRAEGTYGLILLEEGDVKGAIPIFEYVWQNLKSLLGEDHTQSLRTGTNLAIALSATDDHEKAVNILRVLLILYRDKLGPGHWETLRTANNLADVLRRLGELDEAETLIRDTYARQVEILGEERDKTLLSLCTLAEIQMEKGCYGEALPLLEDLVHKAPTVFPKDHPYLAVFLTYLGRCLTELGRYQEAEPLLLEGTERLLAGQSGFKREALDLIIRLYRVWAKPEATRFWVSIRTDLEKKP